jgi:uncharacterized membrane protein YbhN (UPF0104 family)
VGWLLSALGTTSMTICVRTAKWHLLLSEDPFPRSQCDSARSLLGAYALGSITPGRLGDYGRCLFVQEGRRARTFMLTFVDRAFDCWSVLSLGAVSLFVLLPRPVAILVTVLWFGLIPAGFVTFNWLRSSRARPVWAGKLLQTAKGLRHIRIRCFAVWALGASFLDVLTLLFLLEAFHEARLLVALATYPCLVIAGALPISLGGIGPREGLSAILFPIFSISSGVAINISLAFFAFTALIPAIAGAIWIAARPPRLEHRLWTTLIALLSRKEAAPLHGTPQRQPDCVKG